MGGLKTTYRIWILGGHHYIYIYILFSGRPEAGALERWRFSGHERPSASCALMPRDVCTYACMHVCTHACACMRTCVRMCVRACVRGCVCVTCSRRSPLPKAQCLLSHTVSCIYIRLIMTGDPLSVYIIYFSMAENHLEHLYGPHRDVLSVELLDVLGETLWVHT